MLTFYNCFAGHKWRTEFKLKISLKLYLIAARRYITTEINRPVFTSTKISIFTYDRAEDMVKSSYTPFTLDPVTFKPCCSHIIIYLFIKIHQPDKNIHTVNAAKQAENRPVEWPT